MELILAKRTRRMRSRCGHVSWRMSTERGITGKGGGMSRFSSHCMATAGAIPAPPEPRQRTSLEWGDEGGKGACVVLVVFPLPLMRLSGHKHMRRRKERAKEEQVRRWRKGEQSGGAATDL